MANKFEKANNVMTDLTKSLALDEGSFQAALKMLDESGEQSAAVKKSKIQGGKEI